MKSRRTKYTKEALEDAVKRSTSILGVCRIFGYLNYNGGFYRYLKEAFKEFDIDTSHFLGTASNKNKVANNKLKPEEILVKRTSSIREKSNRLKRALLESGIEYRCSECPIKDNWNNKPIKLEIDHIDGDFANNEKSNLRFLCPNCHSQTETFGFKKIRQVDVQVSMEDSQSS